MSMFGYNTLGFGSIAGTAGPPDLDFTVVGSVLLEVLELLIMLL